MFVPRRRTEFLVQQAVALARPGAVIVDLCCGAGAIGAALAAAVERAEVHAADVDPAAVRCARQNLPAGRVYQGDLYEPLPSGLRGRIAILAANVPYVPTGEIGFLPPRPGCTSRGGPGRRPGRARRAAPGGRRAPAWLAPGGHLLSETSERQAALAESALAAAGLTARVATSADLAATVIIGQRPLRSPRKRSPGRRTRRPRHRRTPNSG